MTALYRCYAADGDLLYVGISVDPDSRLQQHVTQSPWWDEVTRVTVHGGFPDRESGRRAERLAIAWEAPRENVQSAVRVALGPGERDEWVHLGLMAPPELAEALRARAKKNYRTVSGEIRYVLQQLLDTEEEAA